MGTQIVSPVARLVQGSLNLEVKKDDNGNPKIGSDGQPEKEVFMAIAVAKTDPGLPQFQQALLATARAEFAALFDAAGNCSHPQFAWKMVDGDTGIDSSGQPVNTKPGFAGCMVFKLNTKFVPDCYHQGKYDPMQQIQDKDAVFKRGCYIQVSLTVAGNGVNSSSPKTYKPGLFLSPNMVVYVAPGEAITSGPDAATTFASAPAIVLPPGVSAIPVTPGFTAPMAPPAPPMAPPAPPMAPPAPPAPPMAPGGIVHEGIAYRLTDKAQGSTLDALIAQGWTMEVLIAHGLLAV